MTNKEATHVIRQEDFLELPAADLLSMLDSVDVIITDPPYSAHVHDKARSVGTNGRGPVDRDFGFACVTPEDRERLSLCASVIPRGTVLFSDTEGSHSWREAMRDAGVEYLRTTPWIRWSQPQLSGDRPGSGHEDILAFHSQHVGSRGGLRPKKKWWNGPGSLTHYDAKCLRGSSKHPAGKPLDLLLALVSYWSDPGELVLDPYGGAGTTSMY